MVRGEPCHARLTVHQVCSRTGLAGVKKLSILAEIHTGGTSRRLLVLAFRGSSDLLDWVRNLATIFNNALLANEGLLVHGGFASAADDPDELRNTLQLLVDGTGVGRCDGLLVTGHSLGGGVAQVSALLLRQLGVRIEASETPEKDTLKPIFAQIAADARRPQLLALLGGCRSITFEAPMAFALKREPTDAQHAARAWLSAHAINYCCATDPVPHLPRHLGVILEAAATAAKQLTRQYAVRLAQAYVAFSAGGHAAVSVGGGAAVSMVPPNVTKSIVEQQLTDALKVVHQTTAGLCEQCEEFTVLAPTIFVGPDEHAQGAGFTTDAEQVTAQLQSRFEPVLRSEDTAQQMLKGIEWHLIHNLAPFVLDSASTVPPRNELAQLGYLEAVFGSEPLHKYFRLQEAKKSAQRVMCSSSNNAVAGLWMSKPDAAGDESWWRVIDYDRKTGYFRLQEKIKHKKVLCSSGKMLRPESAGDDSWWRLQHDHETGCFRLQEAMGSRKVLTSTWWWTHNFPTIDKAGRDSWWRVRFD